MIKTKADLKYYLEQTKIAYGIQKRSFLKDIILRWLLPDNNYEFMVNLRKLVSVNFNFTFEIFLPVVCHKHCNFIASFKCRVVHFAIRNFCVVSVGICTIENQVAVLITQGICFM